MYGGCLQWLVPYVDGVGGVWCVVPVGWVGGVGRRVFSSVDVAGVVPVVVLTCEVAMHSTSALEVVTVFQVLEAEGMLESTESSLSLNERSR